MARWLEDQSYQEGQGPTPTPQGWQVPQSLPPQGAPWFSMQQKPGVDPWSYNAMNPMPSPPQQPGPDWRIGAGPGTPALTPQQSNQQMQQMAPMLAKPTQVNLQKALKKAAGQEDEGRMKATATLGPGGESNSAMQQLLHQANMAGNIKNGHAQNPQAYQQAMNNIYSMLLSRANAQNPGIDQGAAVRKALQEKMKKLAGVK